MAEICLTKGYVAIIDDEDYAWLSVFPWATAVTREVPYAIYTSCWPEPGVRRRTERMHRLILGAPKGVLVDHRDRNTLNNRRSNLRLASNSQNARNQVSARGASEYKGVAPYQWSNTPWLAQIGHEGRKIRIGQYETEQQAARAYDCKATEFFGEFARLNFPRQEAA